MLNPNSPVPLYVQLADILRRKISEGEYSPGSKIESETRLASLYQIGRPTVRQATDQLISKGILQRKKGSGTFVKSIKKEISLFSLAGTSAAFQKKGLNIQSVIIKPLEIKKIQQDHNHPFYGKEVYVFSRLSRVGQNPIIIEDFYLDKEVFINFERFQIENQSISKIVEENYYLKPVGCKQNFTIVYPGQEKSGYLSIKKDDPILKVQRYLDFGRTNIAIYTELYCRTDQFEFSQTIGGYHE